MTLEWSNVLTLIAALGGLGGIAAFIRSRGQNRVDERSQLTTEQAAFRQSMAEQLSALRTQVADSSHRNDVLEAEGRKQAESIAGLTARNEYQERQILLQADQIATLRDQNARQAAQIAALTEEKASFAQRVQVAEATVELLKRENSQLRLENAQLRQARSLRVGENNVD